MTDLNCNDPLDDFQRRADTLFGQERPVYVAGNGTGEG